MPATTNRRIKGLNITELQNCFLRSFFLSLIQNMRQALFSFVAAALCVQQAISHPLDKRAIDGMYIILIYSFISPLKIFCSRCYSEYRHWSSQLRTYSWTSWKCVLFGCSNSIRRESFSSCRFAIWGPRTFLGGRFSWGDACISPDCCPGPFGRSGYSALHI